MRIHLSRPVQYVARVLALVFLCLIVTSQSVSITLAATIRAPHPDVSAANDSNVDTTRLTARGSIPVPSDPGTDSATLKIPTIPPPYWGALPNGGLNGAVLTIAISNTDVYVGGDFTRTADGAVTNLNHIALLRANQWYPVAHNGLDMTVRTIVVSGTTVYVGGDFTQTADNAVTTLGHIASYSGGTSGTWSPLQDNGLNGTVNTIAISGTQFYVGGNFSQSMGGSKINLNHIASYSGGTWSALAHNGLNGSSVNTIAITGTNVYVGGAFSQTSDSVVLNLNAIALYSGGAWSALANNGLDLMVNTIAISGADLYVGGAFRHPADSPFQDLAHIALYSGGTWIPVTGNGLNSDVNALAVIGSDVYVGGNFNATSDNTTTGLNSLARYAAGVWYVPPSGGLDNFVQTLAISGNPTTYTVYAGGQFLKSGDGTNTSLNHIASLQNTLSTNTNLNNLVLSNGTLTPVFSSSTLAYTATVPNIVASIIVTPTAADLNSNVKVNGTTVAFGSSSAPITLSVGANLITTTVTAQDGSTKKDYVVTVTRAKSSNADLSNLALSSGTLSPAFAPGTTAYSATVAQSVASIKVTPTVADLTAHIMVNGAPVTSGTQSGAIPLSLGPNPINVVITAEDTTTKTYSISVTRSNLNGNADLSNLVLGASSLNPAFAPGTLSYTATVVNSATDITVTPTLSDTNASVTVNGTPVTSGSPSSTIPLVAGANLITTTVTAQDGVTIKNYVVTVTRALSNDANLSGLVLSDGTLTPAFAAATTSYAANVANGVTSITITPTTNDPAATITVNGSPVISGTPSSAILLNAGPNLITTTVTAQDGTTKKDYVVTVTRAASSIADLSNLILSSGTLTPDFGYGTLAYTASVPNSVATITVTPVALDTTATITVNGSAVASSTPSGAIHLNVGDTTITTIVTAQDHTTTKTYIIVVTRGAQSKLYLPLVKR